MDWTTGAAIVGAITGIIGTVLGAWNFVQSQLQRRVNLRVVPKLTVIQSNMVFSRTTDLLPDGFACIEVINLSAFAVTIAEVGFSLENQIERGVLIPDPPTLLPKRLEPRESIDVVATACAGFPRNAKRAYATTQCGHTTRGDSAVLRKWRKMSSR